jgi:XTP/dITP diphosphohydrolase
MPRLLLATGNKHKLYELKSLFQDLPYELVSPSEAGIDTEVDECGDSFEENATLKAIAFASESRLLSLADDSGLEVEALGGEPGVLSARYAGADAIDVESIDFLLSRLKNVQEEKRQALFRCVIAIADVEGTVKLFQGECHGTIAFKPGGGRWFRLRPRFLPAASRKDYGAAITKRKKQHKPPRPGSCQSPFFFTISWGYQQKISKNT